MGRNKFLSRTTKWGRKGVLQYCISSPRLKIAGSPPPLKAKPSSESPQCPEELEQRFDAFFEKCSTEGLPPTFEALSLVSGWCYTTFYDISEGKMCTEFTNIIKKAKDVCQIYDSQMAANGKVLAPVYIFRAKNFYGMRDEQKIQIEAQPGADKPQNAEDIVNALPEAPGAIEVEGEIVK